MSKSVKHKVNKGAAKAPYLERKQAEKDNYTMNVYRFAQQSSLDAASLALNETFGFGPERLKRFAEGFEKIFIEIQAINRADSSDPERTYSEQKIEDAMKRVWGPYYEPKEERYR